MTHTITFIYRLPKNTEVFYGKHVVEHLSDDHDGLDRLVRSPLLKALKTDRLSKNIPAAGKEDDVLVGVLSYTNDYDCWSSNQEVKCFDYFYCEYGITSKTFLSGKEI